MKPAARTLDLVEKLVCVALYAWLCARVVLHAHGFASLLILPSEGLVLLFLLIRRGADELSLSPRDWALALAATASPMLVEPGVGKPLVPTTVAAVVLITGVVVQLHAKVVLGRSFGCVAAHRGLKLDGPYRLVRHPVYAGYLISHIGFLLANPTLRNVIAYFVCYALQIPRLVAEEKLLAHDPEYAAYLARVRWRLIPGVF